MTPGKHIKLGLIDGTIVEGIIYELEDEYIIVITETNKLLMIESDDIKTLTVRIGD